IVTSGSELFRIPSSDIQKASAIAAALEGLGTPIGDGAIDGYPLRNILTLDHAAWVSPLSGQAAIGLAYVGMDFEAAEEVIGADVDWVLPANTPTRVRFEYSDDGEMWTQAASQLTTSAPSSSPYWNDHHTWQSVGPHRFWRMVPLDTLQGH